jgi:hypothetical protein
LPAIWLTLVTALAGGSEAQAVMKMATEKQARTVRINTLPRKNIAMEALPLLSSRASLSATPGAARRYPSRPQGVKRAEASLWKLRS